jgi:FecR protein
MKTKSPCALGLATILSVIITVPADIYAEPQAGTQRAGEIARLIPAANIERGAKTITASPKSVVDWHDLVNTQVNGRARVALDDGSVLNVGSESSMKVEKHDPGAQQTELELTYGKLRSQAQKISRPDGKFEVHTPAGVAGVVGTDFYVGFDNATMIVIAFEGIVRVCNLAGVCVLVKAGQMTSVRSGDNSGPLVPIQATLDVLTAAVTDTNVGGGGGMQGVTQTGTHISKGTAITLGILAAIPAVVVPIVSRGSSTTTPSPTQAKGCQPGLVAAGC